MIVRSRPVSVPLACTDASSPGTAPVPLQFRQSVEKEIGVYAQMLTTTLLLRPGTTSIAGERELLC
jgi:hypothetical protein